MTFPPSQLMIRYSRRSSRNELWPCFSYAAQTLLAIAEVIRASLSWNPLKARSAPSEFNKLQKSNKKKIYTKFRCWFQEIYQKFRNSETYSVFSTPPVFAWLRTFVSTFGFSIFKSLLVELRCKILIEKFSLFCFCLYLFWFFCTPS